MVVTSEDYVKHMTITCYLSLQKKVIKVWTQSREMRVWTQSRE